MERSWTSAFPKVAPWVAAGVALFLILLTTPQPSRSGVAFFSLSTAWAALILAAFTGYGAVLGRVLMRPTHLRWAQRAALGMAAVTIGGGVLNLVGVISRPLVIALVLAGALVCARDLVSRRATIGDSWRADLAPATSDRFVLALGAVVVVLAVVQALGSIHGTVNNVSGYRAFDVHDDEQAYLVFPKEMLQTGAIGSQPFDVRRMIGLGGQTFLQAVVLGVAPMRALHMLDGGIALVIFLGLLAGLLRARRVPARFAMLIMLIALLLPQMEARGNTTSVLTGAALLLAWFCVLHSHEPEPARGLPNALVISLFAAALCALKPTFIPVAVFFFAFSTAAAGWRREDRRRALVEALMSGALVFVFLMPWMIALHRSSGTFLYPILGQGNFGRAFTNDFAAVKGDFSVPLMERLDHVRMNVVRAVPLLILLLFGGDRGRRRAVISLAFAAIAAIAVLVLVNDPYLERSNYRYAFPILAAALVATLAHAFGAGEEPPPRSSFALGAVTLPALLLFFGNIDAIAASAVRQPLRNITAALSGLALADPSQVAEARALQGCVPAGEKIFARLANPFLLDFGRNPILIDSMPGMATPPPGIPTFAGGEAVARFLLARHIRYLAYGSKTESTRLLNMTENDINSRYPRSRIRWAMLAYHRDFEASALELARSRRHLFDAEQVFVLDLATPRTAEDAAREAPVMVRPEQAADKVNVLADNNWTTGDATLRGLHLAVTPGHHHVVVALGPAHPFRGDIERLAVRVFVDGRELAYSRADGAQLLFALPDGVTHIDEMRIISSTFVPKALGIGTDGRTLGIPIDWVGTRQ